MNMFIMFSGIGAYKYIMVRNDTIFSILNTPNSQPIVDYLIFLFEVIDWMIYRNVRRKRWFSCSKTYYSYSLVYFECNKSFCTICGVVTLFSTCMYIFIPKFYGYEYFFVYICYCIICMWYDFGAMAVEYHEVYKFTAPRPRSEYDDFKYTLYYYSKLFFLYNFLGIWTTLLLCWYFELSFLTVIMVRIGSIPLIYYYSFICFVCGFVCGFFGKLAYRMYRMYRMWVNVKIKCCIYKCLLFVILPTFPILLYKYII